MFERFVKRTSSSSIGQINQIVNWILTLVLNLEGRLIAKGLAVPFGQGLVIVGRKSA